MNSKNHLKRKKPLLFVGENLKIDMLTIKNAVKLVIFAMIQLNIEVMHIAYVI